MAEDVSQERAWGGPVLFFDGQCGLCERSVRWCLRHDRRRVLRFAPLQGRTYAALRQPGKPGDMSTMVLVDGAGLHVRSGAMLRTLRHVGGVWRVLGAVASVLPRALLDRVYGHVASRRTAWFGGADSCALVAPADRDRFLD